jgi:DNA-binding Lrp family transcriptional regulator
MGYECKICNKKIINISNHLRITHKKTKEEYYKEFDGEKDKYELFYSSQKEINKSNSPNCIEFYLKKGYSREESELLLKKYRKEKLVFGKNKGNSPNQIEFYLKKGFTKEEAIIKIKENNSRSLESYIKKYGNELGIVKYNEFVNSLSNRKESEINNYIKNKNLSKECAEDLFKVKRIKSSPRRVEYWLNKHYSYEESLKKVSEWQKDVSPRTINYWMKFKNMNYNEAIKAMKNFQDNISINSIMKRYLCNLDEAFEIQNKIVKKIIEGMEKNGVIRSYDKKSDYFKYKMKVHYETCRSYKKYKNIINPLNHERGLFKYHLDHKFSIINGFKHNIDPIILGSYVNLELIYCIDNLKKSTNNSITKEDLLEKYKKI